MARKLERLTAVSVASKKAKGRYADGGGLYLQVGDTGGKSWLFRFALNGRAREMGLGALHAVTLKQAREKARECRRLLADGIDPLVARESEHAARRQSVSKTFDECSAAFIAAHRAGWKNEKHAEQWTNTLATYASPVFGSLPVREVATPHIVRVLGPMWSTKTETATRVRGRIEKVLDWARVHGYRDGENPARWRGHLDKLLPPPRRVKKVEHHPSLPYSQIGSFMKDLRAQEGMSARALEFTVLTAARTNEVIAARWDEIDGNVWAIPADRMKAKREHRVPLSAPAVRLLKNLPRIGDYVFPGVKGHLSNMAMLELLSDMERSDITVHGFRSTFRDWAAEQTNFPREIAEASLAHIIKDKTEAAYLRSDFFEKRRKLMDAWGKYCNRSSGGKVLALKRKA